MGELHRLGRGASPPLPAASTAYLATLSGPEQRNTQRAYRSTLRALAAEFTVVLHPDELGWLREALALNASDTDPDEEDE